MKYTPSQREILFKKIISLIEKGASLRAVLKKKEMPVSETFYKWLKEDEDKATRYARATELRAEAIFEDILNIADENYRDVYVDGEGLERTDHDVIQRSKLRVDARKWVLAKMHPTKYGDKIDVTSGNEAINTLPIVGMVIKNEIQTHDSSEPEEQSFDDLL